MYNFSEQFKKALENIEKGELPGLTKNYRGEYPLQILKYYENINNRTLI